MALANETTPGTRNAASFMVNSIETRDENAIYERFDIEILRTPLPVPAQ